MKEFKVFSDSSCDLPASLAKQYDVNIVPLKVSFDRINKHTEGIDISTDQFYNNMEKATLVPKTYFPTVREYVNTFKKALSEGHDVLHLCLSSKLSKGYESACNAGKILSHAFKNKVVVMDSLLASGAQCALTLNAARLCSAGASIDEAYNKLTALRDGAVTILTVESLEQLARGGRMSRSAAAMGTFLHINPIIHMENGMLISREKAIGRRKALHMVKKLSLEAINNNTNDYEFTVFHSRSLNEAKQVEQELRSEYNARHFNPMLEIGSSIGAHTGKSVIAINCMKKL